MELKRSVSTGSVLMLQGKKIRSLEELRANYDSEEIAAAFADGSLVDWLEGCYYEQEAEAVRELMDKDSGLPGIFSIFRQEEDDDEDRPAPSADTLRELCRILGISVPLSPEEKAQLDERLVVMRKVTQDENLLAKVADTATNQAELGELLDSGRSTIYLCGGPFSVPIRKADIHYIGIGSPRMEAPYTEEQYRKAGIAFEGIDLPTTVSPAAVETAKAAARANGYDDFPEEHNALAVAFHQVLDRGKMTRYYTLKHGGHDIAAEFYKSRFQAETAVKKEVDAAYGEAEHYFDPGHSDCVAGEALEHYDATKPTGKLVRKLETVCGDRADLQKKLTQLEKLVDGMRKELTAVFEKELWDNSGYYALYEKSYFVEKADIEELDLNEDPFDSDFMNGLARLVANKTEYSPAGIIPSLSELGNDVNRRAETFFEAAHRLYRDYCEKIETLAQEIGERLTAEDLARMKLDR